MNTRPSLAVSGIGLTQQMSRLRGRLWPFGLDILCLNSYGYLLLSRSNEQGEEI